MTVSLSMPFPDSKLLFSDIHGFFLVEKNSLDVYIRLDIYVKNENMKEVHVR